MKKTFLLIVALFIGVFGGLGNPPYKILGIAPVFAQNVILERGTRVKLKLTEPVSTKTNVIGDEVIFKVADDVVYNGQILIKEGTLAKGVVTNLVKKALIGRREKIEVTLDFTMAVDGAKVPIREQFERVSECKIQSMPLILSFVFSPVLSLVGYDSVIIPENYIINARVERDVDVDIQKKTTL